MRVESRAEILPRVRWTLVGVFSIASVITGCSPIRDIQAATNPKSVIVATECKGEMDVEQLVRELRLAGGSGFRSTLDATEDAYNNASCNVPDILARSTWAQLEVIPCSDGKKMRWREIWDRITEVGYPKNGSRNGRDVLQAFRSAACHESLQR